MFKTTYERFSRSKNRKPEARYEGGDIDVVAAPIGDVEVSVMNDDCFERQEIELPPILVSDAFERF